MAGVASMSVSWGPRIISRSSHLGRNMLMFVNVARATPAGSQTAFESKRNYHSTRSCCSFRGGNKHTAMENIPTWQPTSRNFSAISSKCIARSQTLAFKARASQQRFLSTNSPGKGNDDKGQNKNEPASKTARLLSRLPLPVHENIYTIPNILTFSRLAAAPVIGYCILNGYDTAALSLFAYASITDLVDGYIARKFNQQTVVGTVIDPMADKTLMTIGVVCLALKSAIPLWLAGLILARDVGLAISALYYRWISLPPPKTMARYWDFSLPSAEVRPTAISKANTALQLLLVGSAMVMPVLPEAILSAWHLHEGMTGLQEWKTGLPVRSAVLKPLAGRLVVGWVTTSESRLSYIVAGTTFWSGASYVYSKDAVKILTAEEIERRAALKRKAIEGKKDGEN